MKQSLNIARLTWLDRSLPSIRIANGIPFRKDDDATHNWEAITFVSKLRYWLYFDLLPTAPDRKVQYWFVQYVSTDFALYTEALDAVYELVRRDEYLTLTVSQFKSAIEHFGITPNVLLGPIWPEMERVLVNQDRRPDVKFVRRVVQWTRFDARVTLDAPDQSEACSLRFAENQSRLHQIWSKSDPYRDTIVKRMRLTLRAWIPDAKFEPQPGHHGSGAVADQNDRRNVTRKCYHLGNTDGLLSYYTRKFDVDVITDLGQMTERLHREPLIRVSRWLTVPKSIRKRRGIAPQPAELMWYQQGILDGLYKTVWDEPFIREHFPIFDRSVNQRIAIAGSVYDHWSTYDLSDASDSITVHLVKSIFGPRLRLALLACRCRQTSEHPDMETYGTMGDATVFPTECLAIGAAVFVALAEAKEHDPTVNLRQFYVFGDDICVQNNAAVHEALHRVFAALGFKINDEKSFLSGRYRESCGVEAYLGREIQPWYILNRKQFPVDRANRIACWVAAANHAYWHGYKLTRWFLIDELARLCYGKRFIPFTEVADDNSKVFTPFISDRGKFRRNRDTQVSERCSYNAASYVNDRLTEEDWDDWYKYYLYLLNPPDREIEVPDYKRSFLNRSLRVRKFWTDVRLLEAGPRGR